MVIEEVRSEDTLQLNVQGKVDTFSVDEFQNTLLAGFQKNKNIIVNFEKVDHITSVGLRSLLLAQKTAESRGGTLTIINPNAAVRDIFRVTGFDDLLTIR